MANTLTPHINDLQIALDYVSRELAGMIPAVSMDARVDRAAVNQTINSFVSPAANATFDITPAMAVPAASDATFGNVEVKITKAKGVPFSWNGNEQVSLGGQYLSFKQSQMAQAMRALVNLVEIDLCALQNTFSRAYGTPGTTPFTTANDFTDLTRTLQILKDNGAPLQDNHCVMNTTAGAQFIGKQSAANQQGTDSILRQGVLVDTAGCALRESAQIVTNTAGTVTATIDATGYAVGTTTFTLSAAACALVVGDVVTFAGDTNKYVIVGGTLANAGTLIIGAPGLRVAMSAATKAITVIAAAPRNMVFNRNAIYLATRLPERPVEGDMALDVMTLTDPRSGLSFEVAVYPGQRMVRYEVSLAWGVKNIKPEHTAILLG
jgi:hypothetical protein